MYFLCIFLVAQIVRKKFYTYFIPKNVWGFLLVIALAPPFMSTFSSFKQVIPIINNFSWDYQFMKLDYILHFGHHPWEFFRFFLNYPYIIKVIDRLYMLWFPILFFSCLWMGWSLRRKLRFQFFIYSSKNLICSPYFYPTPKFSSGTARISQTRITVITPRAASAETTTMAIPPTPSSA